MGHTMQYLRFTGGTGHPLPRACKPPETGSKDRAQKQMVQYSQQSGSQDPMQILKDGQASFNDLPEFFRGAIVGAFALMLINSAPMLAFLAIGGASAYYVFSHKEEDKHEHVAAPAHVAQFEAGLGQSEFYVGQSVEVMRSDQTWSAARVNELRPDGSVVVHLDVGGASHAKTIYKSGLQKYMRSIEVAGPSTVALGPENSAGTVEGIASDCTFSQHHHYVVGQSVEVLRSNGSWSRGTVNEVQLDGTIVVGIDGTGSVKSISQQRVPDTLRGFGEAFVGLPQTTYPRPGEGQLANVAFMPGRLSMEVQDETGVVLDVGYGGQAASHGVQRGWKIHHVNGLPYTFDLFYSHVSGQTPYTMTFSVC